MRFTETTDFLSPEKLKKPSLSPSILEGQNLQINKTSFHWVLFIRSRISPLIWGNFPIWKVDFPRLYAFLTLLAYQDNTLCGSKERVCQE